MSGASTEGRVDPFVRPLAWTVAVAASPSMVGSILVLLGVAHRFGRVVTFADVQTSQSPWGASWGLSRPSAVLTDVVRWSAVLAAAACVVAVWRLYRFVVARRPRSVRYRSWWAIGGWFIPIWQAFRPKQIVNDMWRLTDAGAASASGPLRGRRVPAWTTVWWVALLVGAGGVRYTTVLWNGHDLDPTPPAYVRLGQGGADLSAAALVIAAVLAAVLLHRLRARAAQLGPDAPKRLLPPVERRPTLGESWSYLRSQG
jgi:hypothetical protein